MFLRSNGTHKACHMIQTSYIFSSCKFWWLATQHNILKFLCHTDSCLSLAVYCSSLYLSFCLPPSVVSEPYDFRVHSLNPFYNRKWIGYGLGIYINNFISIHKSQQPSLFHLKICHLHHGCALDANIFKIKLFLMFFFDFTLKKLSKQF